MMGIKLVSVTPENWRQLSFEVLPEQRDFVANTLLILSRAYVYREQDSKVEIIMLNETPIGLISKWVFDDGGTKRCILDQFLVDKDFQGKGYGKEALSLWISQQKGYTSIDLCYKEAAVSAKRLYDQMGFVRMPELDDEDEWVMRLNLEV